MEKGIWQEIEELYKEFQQLGISQSVDYEKYYLYSLITHSTAIEGSTLTEMDAQLLFDSSSQYSMSVSFYKIFFCIPYL